MMDTQRKVSSGFRIRDSDLQHLRGWQELQLDEKSFRSSQRKDPRGLRGTSLSRQCKYVMSTSSSSCVHSPHLRLQALLPQFVPSDPFQHPKTSISICYSYVEARFRWHRQSWLDSAIFLCCGYWSPKRHSKHYGCFVGSMTLRNTLRPQGATGGRHCE